MRWVFTLPATVSTPSVVKEVIKSPVAKKVKKTVSKKQGGVPSWYIYLRNNKYAEWGKDDNFVLYKNFPGNEILTRATATPYLAKYASLKGMGKDLSAKCNFSDISSKSNAMQKSILDTCQYGILRGANGDFMPDRQMKSFELFVALVRTFSGYLDETGKIWYKPYYDTAVRKGMIDAKSTPLSSLEGKVTKKELAQWLYRLSEM